jgi:hypothetical protein
VDRTRRINALGQVLAFAVFATGCSAGSSVSPTTVPTATSAPASATAHPGLSPLPSGQPALTETFTSAIHGITVVYPAGWSTRPATEPLEVTEFPRFESPVMDVIYDPARTDHLFLGLLSQALEGRSLDAWAAYFLDAEGCESTESVTIGGAAGISGTTCTLAAVESADRGYLLWLYTSDDVPEWLDGRALFKEILGTVSLDPSDVSDPAP